MVAMTEPKQRGIGQIVIALSLDSSLPLYERLGVPGPADAASALYKDIVARSGFAPYSGDVFPASIEVWNAGDDEARKILGWTAKAFCGTHVTDPDLSFWLMAVAQFNNREGRHERLSEEDWRHIVRFAIFATETIDRAGYTTLADAIKARYALSDWDRRLHLVYGFNFFDRSAGADPFLVLRFVDQGERLREAIRRFDFPADFPHDGIQTAAQIKLESMGVWIPEDYPEGYVVPPLRTLIA